MPHPVTLRPGTPRRPPHSPATSVSGTRNLGTPTLGTPTLGTPTASTPPVTPDRLPGLASPQEMRAKLHAAARGEASLRDAPRLWMSVDALMRLLTPENRALLAMIAQEAPRSVSELAARSGRDQGNLSRTLDKLEQAGLIRLVADGREKRPEMLRRHLHIALDLAADRADCA